MRLLCLESDEDMKLSEGERRSISAEIASQVAISFDLLKPRGWRKALFLLRQFGVLATIPTVFIALLALAGGGWYYAFSRIDKEARFEQSTTDSLQQINEELKLVPVQITTGKLSDLPSQELKAHHDELTTLKKTLASADRNTPNFWPTSFQVINLLSRATSPIEAQHSLVDLSDIDARGNPHFLAYPPGSVLKLHRRIANMTFRDAIIYLDASVILENVTFVNCTIILPDIQIPPPPLQQIGNQLLAASDLAHLVLTAS